MAATVVLVAQAFKGSLSLDEVERALTEGARAAGVVARPIRGGDGGDGLLDAVGPSRRSRHTVSGPLGVPVEAEVGWLESNTAVVESRMACGLSLLDARRRDPLHATTRGVGQLVTAAVQAGALTVVVGLGGSATMDGGLGAAAAWGWIPLDADGRQLPDGGGMLERLAGLRPGPALGARLVGLADVANPLLGPDGAAVYGPQKGAGPGDLETLQRGLVRLVERTGPWNGPALARAPGAGAAGGLGFGLLCFGRATLVPGASWVLDRNGLDGALGGAALVVVPEARVDATSFAGKLTGEVVARARARGVPTVVLTPEATATSGYETIVSAPGRWSARDLTDHTTRAVRAALRLPLP